MLQHSCPKLGRRCKEVDPAAASPRHLAPVRPPYPVLGTANGVVYGKATAIRLVWCVVVGTAGAFLREPYASNLVFQHL